MEVNNQLLTMHGSTVMYLFAVPFLEGLALYLLPMMLGSRDVAFPRLTAFSYWTYLFGGILFYSSFFFGAVPDAGWFAYTPLSGPKYSGLGLDFWLLRLTMVAVAGLTAGVEIVMTISRMPLFIWTVLVMGWMLLALVLWVWHLPPLYEATLYDDLFHDFQHFSFVVEACLFWRVLLDPLSRLRMKRGLGVFMTLAPKA